MSRDAIYLFEQTDFSLRLARCANGEHPLRIEELKEVPIEEASALTAAIPSNTLVLCASRPKARSLHLASADEAKRHSGIAGVRKFAELSASGNASAKWIAAVKASDGGEPADTPWLLSSSAEDQPGTLSGLEALKLKSFRNISAALSVAGALVGTAERTVLVIDLGELGSHAMLVGPEGVLAAGAIALDLARISEAVQTELNLKFRGSAVKLFFNVDYDFTDSGSKIASRLADNLKADLGRFLVDRPAPTELLVTGLPVTQQWFGPQLARALGLAAHVPDLKKWIGKAGITFGGSTTSGNVALGWFNVLHALHTHTGAKSPGTSPWHAEWISAAAPTSVPVATVAVPEVLKNATPAPVLPTKPAAAAPAPAKIAPPSPAAVATSKSTAAVPATAVTDVKPTKSLIAAAAARNSASTPAAKAPAAPAALSPKSAVGTSVPPAQPPAKPAPSTAVNTPPAPAFRPAPVPEYQLRSPKKRAPLLVIGGAIAACVIAGAFFYIDFQSKAAEQLALEKTQVEQRLSAEREKARVAEQRAQEEAEARKKIEVEFAEKLGLAESARQQVESELVTQTAARLANARGSLVIATKPSGAAIKVGNLPPQTSPATFSDIKIGSYPVTITLAGHESVTLELGVVENSTTNTGIISLIAAVGSLQINSEPSNADYDLRPANALLIAPESRRSGKTPATIDDLAPGDYEVTLTREGWASHTQVVSITRGATTHLRWTWPNGMVKITSSPEGATVTRSGIALGVTPLTLSDQPAGEAQYEITLPRFEPALLTAHIEGGKTSVLTAEFKAENRIFTITEVDRKPEPIGVKQPELPYYLTLEGGRVELQLTVNRDGSARNVTVLQTSNEELSKFCQQAVAKWQFKPGMKSGIPVNVSLKLPFVFKAAK